MKLAIDQTLRVNAKYIYDIIWVKQSIPLYWQLLDKKRSSNICQQQALIAPVLELLSDYEVLVLGDREFGSVKLAYWLCQKQVKFIFRVKQDDIFNQKMLITSAYMTGV
ncbi:MAG: transposase [Cyanobacteria bacterium 0813]|nr:transposase [Cyanobacteria bacterium 0813]